MFELEASSDDFYVFSVGGLVHQTTVYGSKAIHRRLVGMTMLEGLVFRPTCHLNKHMPYSFPE